MNLWANLAPFLQYLKWFDIGKKERVAKERNKCLTRKMDAARDLKQKNTTIPTDSRLLKKEKCGERWDQVPCRGCCS